MVKRKIGRHGGSLITPIPGTFLDTLGIKKGDRVEIRLEHGKITIAPVAEPAKTELQSAVNAPQMDTLT